MAGKYLGPAFDIHGGGVDLVVSHHENEQAQSRAAGHLFASYWLHNAWITTSGEKMSKSLGNSLLIPAVLERARSSCAVSSRPTTARTSSSPSRPSTRPPPASGGSRTSSTAPPPSASATTSGRRRRPGSAPRRRCRCPEAFVAAMDDDLGTPAAVAVLYDTVREGNKLLADGPSAALITAVRQVVEMLGVLGLDPRDPGWPTAGGSDAG